MPDDVSTHDFYALVNVHTDDLRRVFEALVQRLPEPTAAIVNERDVEPYLGAYVPTARTQGRHPTKTLVHPEETARNLAELRQRAQSNAASSANRAATATSHTAEQGAAATNRTAAQGDSATH